MDSSTLSIILKAQDEASKQLQLINNELKNMGDASQATGGKLNYMSEAWGKSVDASKQFAIGVAAAAAVVVGFGVAAVNAFNDSENRIAQTNAVLKSTGEIAGVTADQVTKLSKSLQQQTTYSDEDVRSAENLLLTFTKIGKDIFPQATSTVLDMATALGEDTKSAAIQLGKALQDPILGVTALRRVGVNFSEAQKDVIKNLVETGQSAKAQQLILKELNTEFGGSAAAAASTFDGKIKQINNTFNDFQELVGQVIVNALIPLIGSFETWLEKAGGIDGVMQTLTDSLSKLAPWIPTITGAIIGGLLPAIIAMGIALWTSLAPLLPFLAAGALLGYVLNNLAVSMGGWDVLLGKVNESLKKLRDIIAPVLVPALQQLWEAFSKNLLPALEKFWKEAGPTILVIAKDIATVLGVLIVANILILLKWWTFLVNALAGIINVVIAIKDGLVAAWQTIAADAQVAWTAIATGAQEAWDTITRLWKDITGWFTSIWEAVTGTVVAWGTSFSNAIQTAFKSASKHVETWQNDAPKAVKDTFSSINAEVDKWNIPFLSKLSRVYTGALQAMIGYDLDTIKAWKKWGENQISAIGDWYNALGPKWDAWWEGTHKSFDTWKKNSLKWVGDSLKGIGEAVGNYFSPSSKDPKSFFGGIKAGLDGSRKAWDKWKIDAGNWTEDALKNVGKRIRDFFLNIPKQLEKDVKESGKKTAEHHTNAIEELWKNPSTLTKIAEVIGAVFLAIPALIVATMIIAGVNIAWILIRAIYQGFNEAQNWLNERARELLINLSNYMVTQEQRFYDWAVNLVHNIGNGIKGAASGMGDVFSGMWDGMKNGFKGAVNWIVDGINGLVGNINGLSGKIPGGSAIKIPTVPKLATGTSYFSGGLALVGEQGPELVNLPQGAKVNTADKTAQMLGGGQGHVELHVNVGVYAGQPGEIDNIAAEIYRGLQRVARRHGLQDQLPNIGVLPQ